MSDSIIVKPSTFKERKLAAKKALIVGAARGLRLLERMPALFLRRGWDQSKGQADIASTAVCMMVLGGLAQKINVPKEIWDEKQWHFAGETEGVVTAAEVVAHLDLKEMMGPAR